MLRRSKKIVKRLADDASSPPLTVHHSEDMRITDNNASLESTVFGGESRITEQLENFEVVTSGFKVSSVTGFLCVFHGHLIYKENSVMGSV